MIKIIMIIAGIIWLVSLITLAVLYETLKGVDFFGEIFKEDENL